MPVIDYKLDGATKTSLDTITSGPNIAYWQEDDGFYYTNEKHLSYINSTGAFTIIDVDATIATLRANSINQEVDEDISIIEEIAGQDVKIEDLSNVNLQNPTEGEVLSVDSLGNIINIPKPDHQKAKESEPWSTNDTDWEVLHNFCFSTKSYATADYRIEVSMVATSSSNKTEFAVGIFVDDEEQEDITRTYYFRDKDDTKSITTITYVDDVAVGSIIDLRIKRISKQNGFIQTTNRTFIVEEF